MTNQDVSVPAKGVDRPRLLAAVRELLEAIGEDPEREGLQQTPRRVADMYIEMFSGMNVDARDHMDSAIFDEESAGDTVTVGGIWFNSMCEHHLLPFRGTVEITYAPSSGRVVGLSKLARVVDVVSRRPQVQERMTQQILDAVANSDLKPAGVKIEVEAEHMCMSVRGVRQNDAKTYTSASWGTLAS